MKSNTSSRIAAVVGPAVAAALLLGACGGDDSDAASKPTVTLAGGETSYATIAPATTSTLAPEEAAASGPTTDYEVQAGDYGIKVADDFGITLAELAAANGWADVGSEFPGPGSIIKIPANATAPAEETDDDADADDDADGDAEETASTETGETIPDPGSNCEAGSYTIEEGDTSRTAVAEKFDVTVEAMDEANQGTNGYDAFYPGLKIVIPAKDDC
ncbi:LysM peptidoglycan-binding domain-containing protein [Ilumatobacter nonamiensis]|uniref:LysM peptidoglycan-binding domain-containing protein n=1 Tax=Ilumatobacter nonamiensis TaxID=467093 RepID=UPI000345299B|nr:LysM peptidoglycan-binding domain-containing protein [Ilumatobacter nonamiensis]